MTLNDCTRQYDNDKLSVLGLNGTVVAKWRGCGGVHNKQVLLVSARHMKMFRYALYMLVN